MQFDQSKDQPTIKIVRDYKGDPMRTPTGDVYSIMSDPFEGKEWSGDVQHTLPIEGHQREALKTLASHSIEQKKRFPTQKILGILELFSGKKAESPIQYDSSYGIYLTPENVDAANEFIYIGEDWTNPEAWFVSGKNRMTAIFIKNHRIDRD